MNNGNLKYQFARLSIAEKLIVINLAVFIVFGLAGFLLNLVGVNPITVCVLWLL